MKLSAGVYQGPSIRCDPAAALAKIDEILCEASARELDIVQFPELFMCGYDISAEEIVRHAYPVGGASIESVGILADKHAVAVGIGYAERAGDGRIYNACCVFDAFGQMVLNYRKTHLWDPTFEGEKVAFHPGDDLPVAELRLPRSNETITIGVLICFDCEFPEPARVLALKGASVILIPTAVCDDSTPRVMIPCRAAENHVALVYSNLIGLHSRFPSSLQGGSDLCAAQDATVTDTKGTYFCGQSAIIAPNGDSLVRAGRAESGLFSGVIDSQLYVENKKRNDYLKERRSELYNNLLPSSL